ncbi:Lrp/AsnC family transcriptional regulator [Candidatus Woesearchaeota archaeon]|nr:Lrp/AsnC family transcriptional regulator [Candidatus Woesearchaeota archaeon]
MKNTNYFSRIDEFKKKTKFNEKLGLDNRDNTLLTLISKNPDISQEEIARAIKLSQPSVGARLRKLREKGILYTVNGVNFRIVDLFLAKVDVNATDLKEVIDKYKDCPFFVNALVMSGRYNLCLLFTATDLKRLEGIVNSHLRGNPKVKDVEMNIVISTAKDLILPLNIDYNNEKQINCPQECKDCL